jgi:glycosyltransferase involved in cell wall biosynthesis
MRTAHVLEEIETADVVVSQSDFGRSTYLAGGVAAGKVVALPLGVDTSLFCPGPRPSVGGPLRVLYVGSVCIRKGVQYLLEAFQQLPPEVATLTVVGVSRSELPAIYREADVMVLPSLCDSFGQVVVEALACGTPVIATTDCGAMPRQGVDGLVVPPGDTQALTAAIHQLAKDRDLLHDMGERAPQGVRTWEDFQADLLDLALRTVKS